MKVQILKKNFGSTNRINGNTGYACKPIVLFTFILSMFLSCSKDDNPMDNNQQDIKGRFDNSPFVWDEQFYSSCGWYLYRWYECLFGKMMVQLHYEVSPRPEIHRIICLFIFQSTSMLVLLISGFSLPDKLGNEIALERNPIDVVYNFNDPFIDSINEVKPSSSGYKVF